MATATSKPKHENIPQVLLYNAGVKSAASDIRYEHPQLSRRAAKQLARETVDADPTDVRMAGAKRIGKRVMLAVGITAGAAGLAGLGAYAFDHSPTVKYQQEHEQGHGGDVPAGSVDPSIQLQLPVMPAEQVVQPTPEQHQ